MTPANGERLGWPVLLAYALPAAAIALPTIPVFIHLPSLYGDTLGVGLAATGFALLTARLFDTVTDPLIGWLSDRFALRGAKRKHWIAIGALVAGPALHHLLAPPATVDSGYLLLWSVVLYAGWTLIAVPYLAWGAELNRDYNERTRVTSWREGASLIGIVLAGAVAAVMPDVDDAALASAGVIADATIALGLVTLPLLFWLVPDATLDRGDETQAHPRRAVARLLSLARNKPFLRLIGAWFVNGIANGIPAALFFLYLDHGLGVEQADRSPYVVAYFVAAIAAIPAWLTLSRRTAKHRAWCWAMILNVAAFSSVPFLGEGATAAFMVVCIVTGACLGADLALPPAIQADVVDYERLRAGRNRAGLQFALWGMATKLALALSVGAALPALERLGFDPAAPDPEGIRALTVIYALAPVVIKAIAIMIVWRFPITPEKHDVIRRRLDRTARPSATQS